MSNQEEHQIIAYCDGAVAKERLAANAGLAGIGIVLLTHDNQIKQIGEPIGQATCQEAELQAIRRALGDTAPELRSNFAMTIYTDSQIAIHSIECGSKNRSLEALADEIRTLMEGYKDVKFEWVKGNDASKRQKQADSQAKNAALSQRQDHVDAF